MHSLDSNVQEGVQNMSFLAKDSTNVAGETAAALTCVCLVITGRPAPVPPVSCWRVTAGHVTRCRKHTCCSRTASASGESLWTRAITQTCTCPCPSYITSYRWTTTAWRGSCTTRMCLWMSSGVTMVFLQCLIPVCCMCRWNNSGVIVSFTDGWIWTAQTWRLWSVRVWRPPMDWL